MLIITDSFNIGCIDGVGLDENEIKKRYTEVRVDSVPITIKDLNKLIKKELEKGEEISAIIKDDGNLPFINLLKDKSQIKIEKFIELDVITEHDVENNTYILIYYNEPEFYTISNLEIQYIKYYKD